MLGPHVEQFFYASILPVNIYRKNFFEHDLRCLHLNYQVYDILLDSLSRDVYFAIIPQDDPIIDAPYIWTKIHEKYVKCSENSLLLP